MYAVVGFDVGGCVRKALSVSKSSVIMRKAIIGSEKNGGRG